MLLTIDTTFTVNPHIYPDPGFDAARDLEPVATCATFPVVLVTHPGSGIAGLDGLAEEARRRPPLLYGSGGSGTPGHLAMEHLRAALGLPPGAMEHVAFRGNPQVLAELVAGRVRTGFVAIGGGGGVRP
ncbi:Bug family tripartite tricarboxylate transporter substrate binding protein [Siccirubricoccus deserti]